MLIFLPVIYQPVQAQTTPVIEPPTSKFKQLRQAKAYNDKATRAYNYNDIPLADSLINIAIYLAPEVTDHYFVRAMIREAQKAPFAALVDYETVINMEPENMEAHFKTGQLYYNLENYEEAIKAINRVLMDDEIRNTTKVYFQTDQSGSTTGVSTLVKMDDDLFNLRGLCHQAIGLTEKALDDFEMAQKLAPGESEYVVNEAMLHLDMNDTSTAIQKLNNALNMNPQNERALYNLSLLTDISESQYDKLYEEQINPLPFEKRAYENFVMENYEAAIRDYTIAINLTEDKSAILTDRGRAYFKMNELTKAIDDFNHSLTISPQKTHNYYLLGNTYYQLKNYPAAVEHYSIYLTENQDNAGAYFNYGLSLHMINKDKEACFYLKKALAMGVMEAQKPLEAFCQNP